MLELFVLVFITLCPFQFAIILTKKRAGCFGFVVFQMSCCCKKFVALPHGAVCWSAVFDCGVS